jgi:hypothetical protein
MMEQQKNNGGVHPRVRRMLDVIEADLVRAMGTVGREPDEDEKGFIAYAAEIYLRLAKYLHEPALQVAHPQWRTEMAMTLDFILYTLDLDGVDWACRKQVERGLAVAGHG